MCTVTFIPLSDNKFILTSSRDEQPSRDTIPPKIYNEENIKLLFPKDVLAGGTWIGASSRNRVLTLMNGGFVNHKRKPKYRLSRGLIVLELLKTNDLDEFVKTFNFEGVEPFTIVLVDFNQKPQLYQIVWDEIKIHFDLLESKPRIWSSTPLYPRDVHAQREEWFDTFLNSVQEVSEEDIWKFHHEAGTGDKNTSLIMDRGFIKTKSITRFVVENTDVNCLYHDLQIDIVDEVNLRI